MSWAKGHSTCRGSIDGTKGVTRVVRSGLSKDDAIVFWIRLQLCGVVDFLQDSVVSQS